MQHAEACPSCGTFWNELQAAQQLTLSLRGVSVSRDFRDGLWERIQAGEGSPQAVFGESIPLASKLRYTVGGAAAAAMLLLGATFLFGSGIPGAGEGIATNRQTATTEIDDRDATTRRPDRLVPRSTPRATLASTNMPTMPLTARPLTFDVLAVETARQLEESYVDASIALRMLHDRDVDRQQVAVRVLDDAREVHQFGELLVELCDRERVSFRDTRLDADLRFAVEMLRQAVRTRNDAASVVETLVEPVLTRVKLSRVANEIRCAPSDLQTETEDLMRINTMRPEVFPKLFVVLGHGNSMFDRIAPHIAFTLTGECGPSWVTPRSEMRRFPQLTPNAQGR